MTKKELIKKNIITYLSVALCVAFTLTIFAPFELYLSNKDFFFFEGYDLIGIMSIAAATLVILIVLLLFIVTLIRKKETPVLLGGGMGLLLALYIQGNFLPGDYGALDGIAIEWDKYIVRGIVSVAVFCIVIIACIILSLKMKYESFAKMLRVLSVCLILVELTTLSTLYIQKGGLSKDKKYLSTTDGEFSYSEDENVVVIMLDSFDATVLNQVVTQDESGTYSAMLKDYTFYPDTSGMYKSTILALPYLMNGKEYLNDCTYEDYLEASYKESGLLNKLKEDDWYTGIYNLNRMPASETTLMADNCREVELSVSSHRRLGEYFVKLVGFRYLPQPLKKYCWFYGDDINTNLMTTVEDVELYSDVNATFMENMTSVSVDNAKKSFHFYELLGAHPPYYMTADGSISSGETDTYETAKGLITMLNNYADGLKANGIYDNTTIIVLADHGTDVRWNPVFMIKYANTDHEFEISDVPFSYAYLQELYCAVLDGKTEEECKSIIQAHQGEDREFLLYDENKGMNDRDYFTADIYRCVFYGEAWSDSMHLGTEVYKCAE